MFGGPVLELVSPSRVAVTTRGQARVRVKGRGFGVVRVGGERRWVWGGFDETFVVRWSPRLESVSVLVTGLGRWRRAEVPCRPVLALSPPSVTRSAASVRVHVAPPRARRVSARPPQGPRVVRLMRADRGR